MVSRYEVWLNDVALSSIDPAIHLTDIAYDPIQPERTTTKHAGRDGSYSGRRDSISANKTTVSFSVRKYSTTERQRVVNEIQRWATGGGWLKTSDRQGQRIRAVCTKFPAVQSAMRWLDTLTVEFTAYDWPFWEDEIPNTATVGSGGTGTLLSNGARPCDVEAVITAYASVSSFTATCGGTSIALSGISLSDGDVVNIRYTEDHHLLEIKKGTTSLLDKRTTASSDDLIAQPGSNAVSFTCSASASCQFIAKGAYL